MGESETEKTRLEIKLISNYERLECYGKNFELSSLVSGDNERDHLLNYSSINFYSG